MSDRIGFIGAGNMAGAILEGILKKQLSAPSQLAIYDVDKSKYNSFTSRGINSYDSISELAQNCNIIFLSVKPQNYEDVLLQLKPFVDESKILVSIAAGISSTYIKLYIGFECKVVRVMPNTPLLLGVGATAICKCPPVCDSEFEKIVDIFKSGGIVEVLPEDKMNAIIAVNGSSPAYVYLFAKAVIDGAVKLGIDAQTAKTLICKTLEGSAKMLTNSGMEPEELIKMVSSPGGTTLKALEALYEHGFEESIKDAMKRCTERAEELGR
jgi:pyrroline-5-carboxylate reductase